jgi:hypothetical protein
MCRLWHVCTPPPYEESRTYGVARFMLPNAGMKTLVAVTALALCALCATYIPLVATSQAVTALQRVR